MIQIRARYSDANTYSSLILPITCGTRSLTAADTRYGGIDYDITDHRWPWEIRRNAKREFLRHIHPFSDTESVSVGDRLLLTKLQVGECTHRRKAVHWLGSKYAFNQNAIGFFFVFWVIQELKPLRNTYVHTSCACGLRTCQHIYMFSRKWDMLRTRNRFPLAKYFKVTSEIFYCFKLFPGHLVAIWVTTWV